MNVEHKIRSAGLRPTRQRVALARLLFGRGHRHLAAEDLHLEATARGIAVSVATVYNTLRQFTEAGLLRILSVEGNRTWFDTDVSEHHHFFVEGSQEILDAPSGTMTLSNLPPPPEGMQICGIDVVIRIRTKKTAKPKDA